MREKMEAEHRENIKLHKMNDNHVDERRSKDTNKETNKLSAVPEPEQPVPSSYSEPQKPDNNTLEQTPSVRGTKQNFSSIFQIQPKKDISDEDVAEEIEIQAPYEQENEKNNG